MQNYKVVKYSSDFFQEWNNFIQDAKNSTFLFHREFIEYHQDRFEDYSQMIYKGSKLIAVFPANRKGNTVYSHEGLTYGGLILPKEIKFEAVIQVFKELLLFLNNNGCIELILKQIPSIYNTLFTEEIQYLMYVLQASLIKRETLSVLNMENKVKVSGNRLEGYKRGVKHQLVVREENQFEPFWNSILIPNLRKKHNAKPVHSLQEIEMLKASFPKNIRQFNVYKDDEIIAGTTIFESGQVAHSQYISGSEQNNQLGSLDFLYIHLINNVFKNKKYFDFGTSNECDGLKVNKGLQFWKEGFGARTVTQDFYNIFTSNHKILNEVLI
ncbi:GNAT family N-acetyltransferase [Tamlana sp. 2201CG12-4]|uniref:GNAT family N-acetyltransferase n=1 Tax=Tamlana sp. 2201CG12-4 TaxID=3112582 RepID=UPI002DBC4B7B|nr:GNAT family N-acetyltransferase [Tamlana sp. 2201CG12-4]MEC3907243.1 GNAT family N-acetyltransferase [Tamlana sp. 2201CG12-4]